MHIKIWRLEKVVNFLVMRESDLVRTSVTLPRHLRAHAKDKGISLSRTLAKVLEDDFKKGQQGRVTQGYQPTSSPEPVQTTHPSV